MKTACCETAPKRQACSTPENRPANPSFHSNWEIQGFPSTVSPWIEELCRIACQANKCAKEAVDPRDRAFFYACKCQVDSALLTMGAAYAIPDHDRDDLIIVVMPNGCRQHAPLRWLSPEARQVAQEQLERAAHGRPLRAAA